MVHRHPRVERGLAQGKNKHELGGNGQWPGLVRGLEGERLKIGDKEVWGGVCGWTQGSGVPSLKIVFP